MAKESEKAANYIQRPIYGRLPQIIRSRMDTQRVARHIYRLAQVCSSVLLESAASILCGLDPDVLLFVNIIS